MRAARCFLSGHSSVFPTAVYGEILLMVAEAYLILQQCIISAQGSDSMLKNAFGNHRKGKFSALLYLVAIASAFWSPARSDDF